MSPRSNAILDLLRGQRAAVASVFAMSIKAAGALLTIAVFTLAARALSADEFGQLAIWFNALSLLAVAAVFGQDTLIARSWGEYSGRGEHDVARRAYRFGWQVTILSGGVFALGLLVLAFLGHFKLAPAAVFAGAAFLFAQTVLHFSSHASRVQVGFVISEVNRELTWRLVLLFAVAWAAFHQGFSLARFFVAGAAGMVLSVIFQTIAVRRKLAREPVALRREANPSAWLSRAHAMWLSAIVEATSQYADVMLIGYFASPAAAGDYFVAARLANIFLMVSTGLHTYSMTHSANLFFSNQTSRLQDILRSLAIVSLAFLLPSVVILLVAGEPILTIFGARYAAAYPVLIVLTLASFVRSLCGPAPGILLTTGHEHLYSWVVILATAARMALTAALATKFGAFGAAWAWAIGNVPLAVGLAILCRLVCEVDPSVAAIFTRSRGTVAP
jgi:O-antigen/teichoic acid export membrane protein